MTDFEKDTDKYLLLAKEEDVYVIRNGKPYVKIVDVKTDRANLVKELAGSIHLEKPYGELMDERYDELLSSNQ